MTEHLDSNAPLQAPPTVPPLLPALRRMMVEMKPGFHNQSFIGFINHTPRTDSCVCLRDPGLDGGMWLRLVYMPTYLVFQHIFLFFSPPLTDSVCQVTASVINAARICAFKFADCIFNSVCCAAQCVTVASVTRRLLQELLICLCRRSKACPEQLPSSSSSSSASSG